MQENDPLFVKVIIVGDSGVGKTSLLNRYCYSKFDSTISPTIGTDFSTKILRKNEKILRLQLWDIAGQERFKAVSKIYIRGCLGCIIVADATQDKTLRSVLDWKKVVVENSDYLGEDYNLPFVLLENKIDLLRTQCDSQEAYVQMLKKRESKLQEFTEENGINKGFLSSAKENINLEEAFIYLSEKILIQLEGKQKNETNFCSFKNDVVLSNNDDNKNEKKKCC